MRTSKLKRQMALVKELTGTDWKTVSEVASGTDRTRGTVAADILELSEVFPVQRQESRADPRVYEYRIPLVDIIAMLR